MRITSAPQTAVLAPPMPPRFGAPETLRERKAAGALPALLGGSVVLLVLAAVAYNTLLAFLNARGISPAATLQAVIATELLVMAAAGFLLLRSRLHQVDTPALLLFAFFLFNAVVISLVNAAIVVEMARNAAVIAIFLMIGMRATERAVTKTFAITAGLIFVVLVLESLWTFGYARLFEPGLYFELTRGIARNEFDEIGLFANALGFEDRFAILELVAHRTSSLYLEQVSLANFAIILTVFLVGMWDRLSPGLRIAYPLLIALILVTNNSRTALGIILAAPIVYLLAPRLPRMINLALMPAILITAAVMAATKPPSDEDNLAGRIGLTVETLQNLDLAALLGGKATEAAGFADSGYTFAIYASSIAGLLVLWLFFSLISAGRTAAQKRAGMLMGMYLFVNLIVSGTSVFSIKTAALLWLLIGFLRREGLEEEASGMASSPAAALAGSGAQRRP